MNEPMTGRQRMLAAFARREADCVPVSPDISAMVPVRLSGRPFDEMFLDGLPHNGYASASVAQAYSDAVRYYGMDGCAVGGGFVLSTGDQCGRDTPDANLFKLVEVARMYGRYH